MSYLLKLLYPIALVHYLVYYFANQDTKEDIEEDVEYMNFRCKRHWSLITYLVYEKPYRNLFYWRLGRKRSFFLKWLLSEYPLFHIGDTIEKIGGGAFVLNHPYATTLNARRIGKHFTICQCSTLGNKQHGRNEEIPVIGDDVMLGANVLMLGNIAIGNNVVIAAGSVVVKDVPDNCMVAGNPAVIKKRLPER